MRFDESCDFCEDDEFSFRMARKAKGYVRIADAKYHYFQNFNGMLRSGSYVSEALLRVMSRIESDQAVANDPELSELAHKKKISALFMIYLKYLRAGDRQNALRISHMMRELISRYGCCGISKKMRARVELMRLYRLSGFVELSAIWVKNKKYNK